MKAKNARSGLYNRFGHDGPIISSLFGFFYGEVATNLELLTMLLRKYLEYGTRNRCPTPTCLVVCEDRGLRSLEVRPNFAHIVSVFLAQALGVQRSRNEKRRIVEGQQPVK